MMHDACQTWIGLTRRRIKLRKRGGAPDRPLERTPRRFRAAALLGMMGLTAACAPRPESGVPPTPNVLLITIDTLRRDHLSAYGYPKPTSPFIDGLATLGTRFTSAYSTSNITNPSHASILTGLYAKHHGITTNNVETLHEDVVTLAEIFREHGYRTFAATGTNLLNGPRSGLGQGFEHYSDPGEVAQRRADAVVRSALDRMRSWRGSADRPFFAWLHVYDPHTPYQPARRHFERFWRPPAPGEDRPRLPAAAYESPRLVNGAVPASAALGKNRDPVFYAAAYDAEIAFVDEQLARFFERLGAWGVGETIVALTADHGEMLGEYGIYYNHASVYEPVAAVPLVLLVPGRRLPPVVDAVVETVDLAPTLLELCGLSSAHPFDGESLVPLLEGRERRGDLAGYAFIEHSHGLQVGVRDGSGALIASVSAGGREISTPFRSFDTGSFLAYVRSRPLAFYPRGRVSAEVLPVDPDDDPRAEALLAVLRRWRAVRRPYPEPHRRDLTPEELRQLTTLGYL